MAAFGAQSGRSCARLQPRGLLSIARENEHSDGNANSEPSRASATTTTRFRADTRRRVEGGMGRDCCILLRASGQLFCRSWIRIRFAVGTDLIEARRFALAGFSWFHLSLPLQAIGGGKLKGWARTWTSYHQIPRLDGDRLQP
jgi:hypothetical protein